MSSARRIVNWFSAGLLSIASLSCAAQIVDSDGARIVIGGSFTSVDNQARKCIARLLASGAFDPIFNVNDDIFAGNFDL